MKKYFFLLFLLVSHTAFAIDLQLNMLRDFLCTGRAYQASTWYGEELRIYVPPDNRRNMTFTFAGETITLDLSLELRDALNVWKTATQRMPSFRFVQMHEANFVVHFNAAVLLSSDTVAMGIPQGSGFGNSPNINVANLLISPEAMIAQNLNAEWALHRSFFATNISSRAFIRTYFRYLLVHEIGHILGFGHAGQNPPNFAGLAVMMVLPENHYPIAISRPAVMMATGYFPALAMALQRLVQGPEDIEISPREIITYQNVNPIQNSNHTPQARRSTKDTCISPQLSFDTSNEIDSNLIFKDTPTWIDLYGRGVKDFCTVDNTKGRIQCYKNNNGNFAQRVLDDAIENDLGWSNSRIFMQAGKSSQEKSTIGYCRLVLAWTRLRCNFYATEKDNFIRTKVEETNALDGGWWDKRTILAGDNTRSNNRWWVDLHGDGRLSYCRLVDYTRMACRLFQGIEAGFSDHDVYSEWIDAGWADLRGWISHFRDNSAYCRLTDSDNLRCLPFDKKTQQFGQDINLGILNPGDYKTTKWIDNFTAMARVDSGGPIIGILSSAYCRILNRRNGPKDLWSCLTSTSDFNQSIQLAQINELNNNLWTYEGNGLVKIPYIGTTGYCSITRDNKMHCGLRDFQLTQHQLERVFINATSAPIDPGREGVSSGDRAWLFYRNADFTEQNSLFCRRVNEENMRCTKIYYQ